MASLVGRSLQGAMQWKILESAQMSSTSVNNPMAFSRLGVRGVLSERKTGKLVTTQAVSGKPPVQSDEYNRLMQLQMRNPYEYYHELGMNYTRIDENFIVGSQPQSQEDIDRLFDEEGVTFILNLQQDKDVQYWGIDLAPILRRCKELGIWHMRVPARDFDGQSLRQELPKAVSQLDWAISEGRTVYVHCTAGLGRAPGVAIAYLFWFKTMDLETAYNFLTSKRPCGPKKDAIRGATYDLAKTDEFKPPFEQLPNYAFADVASWERQLIQQRVRELRMKQH